LVALFPSFDRQVTLPHNEKMADCILALADDMTGALEVGAKFSAAGLRSLVSANPVEACPASVLVYDTETRHSSPEAACQEVRRFVAQTGRIRPRLIYKKTDSTLRGNISAEVRALAELYPLWRIGYAPAYPALGRTVKRGRLYVDGVPVGDTEFARDVLNPVRTSSISAILGSAVAYTIFDGETDADISKAASTILADESMRIAMGPAALAGEIAEQIDMPREVPPPLPQLRTCLVLSGSLHGRSSAQMRHAEMRGCISADACAPWRMLARDHAPGAEPAHAARVNAGFLVDQLAAAASDAIFVSGGDTAFAVCAELGCPPLLPLREIVPGVPVTRIEAAQLSQALPRRQHDLYLITKAGGFGELDVLCQIRERLNGQ
jgi:D-threonate/D-erythronate kinase